MCQLFETIKIINGELQNLSLHDERLNRSRKILFNKNDKLKLSECITVPDEAKEGTYRCRVIYTGSIKKIEFSPYQQRKIATLKIVDAGNLIYDFKYLDRSKINSLIVESAADDILIVRNGHITDSSYANIVFNDGQQWITPDTPLLRGTMRALLLQRKTIIEGKITVDDLSLFTHFRLINAMIAFDAPNQPISNLIFN